jgi:hypothetical protein
MPLSTARRWIGATSLIVALGTPLAGCGDSTGPSDLSGTYHATKMTVVQNGQTTNMLAQGASLTVTLTPADSVSGTTAGSLVVPAAYTESGTQETEDLTGTYAYDRKAKRITFDQAADTFIRDIIWTVDGTKLTGTFDAGAEGRLDVVLTQ